MVDLEEGKRGGITIPVERKNQNTRPHEKLKARKSGITYRTPGSSGLNPAGLHYPGAQRACRSGGVPWVA